MLAFLITSGNIRFFFSFLQLKKVKPFCYQEVAQSFPELFVITETVMFSVKYTLTMQQYFTCETSVEVTFG